MPRFKSNKGKWSPEENPHEGDPPKPPVALSPARASQVPPKTESQPEPPKPAPRAERRADKGTRKKGGR